ncbi:REST corepressor 3 [Trichonephila clavata]|uniref:REST corepressor 3 n=1 Tax=Trichonephila clavata TaxID=2740835 RepID=A0A8X6LU57_TRICU|nr:REST corepressor 3 [Trichonephila clavata]
MPCAVFMADFQLSTGHDFLCKPEMEHSFLEHGLRAGSSSHKYQAANTILGHKYQADIPNLIPEGLRPKDENEEDGLIWSPCSTIDDKILVGCVNETREKLEYSQEQSLGILYWNAYDLEKTRKEVLKYRAQS